MASSFSNECSKQFVHTSTYFGTSLRQRILEQLCCFGLTEFGATCCRCFAPNISRNTLVQESFAAHDPGGAHLSHGWLRHLLFPPHPHCGLGADFGPAIRTSANLCASAAVLSSAISLFPLACGGGCGIRSATLVRGVSRRHASGWWNSACARRYRSQSERSAFGACDSARAPTVPSAREAQRVVFTHTFKRLRSVKAMMLADCCPSPCAFKCMRVRDSRGSDTDL